MIDLDTFLLVYDTFASKVFRFHLQYISWLRSSDLSSVVFQMPTNAPSKEFYTIVGIIFQSNNQIRIIILGRFLIELSCLILFLSWELRRLNPLFDKKNYNNRIYFLICPAEVGNFFFQQILRIYCGLVTLIDPTCEVWFINFFCTLLLLYSIRNFKWVYDLLRDFFFFYFLPT